jgi:hypothetical protein
MRSDKVWNPKLPEMPVDDFGHWINYPTYGCKWEVVHQPFWAVMKIDGMRTGRSSKIVILEDINTNKTYPMFVADLVKGIREGALDVKSLAGEGYLTANWTGSKRGANYGIRAVA